MIEASWHDDGHVIHLELVKTAAHITTVSCPDSGECSHDDVGCIVRYFLDIYGLECNVGVADMAADMPIAWTLIGKATDLDACQLWIIPREDATFAAWIGGGDAT